MMRTLTLFSRLLLPVLVWISCMGLLSAQTVTNQTTMAAFSTIQAAVTAASPGDVLSISAHTFNERVVIDKSLTLAGAGTTQTILDGAGLPGTGSGISITNNVLNVTIRDLAVGNYALSGSSDAGIAALLGNNGLTVQNCEVYANNGGRGGVYVNGPVSNVMIDNVKAHDHASGSRGIVIWNGFKQNITIQNCEVYDNNCCGIELQDGTASGVIVQNNNIHDNADNGLGLTGLKGGAGANLITNNTLANNGRFGMELKNPSGTGLNTGDGSILVTGNTISLTPSPTMNIRDHAGISVYRRAFTTGTRKAIPMFLRALLSRQTPFPATTIRMHPGWKAKVSGLSWKGPITS